MALRDIGARLVAENIGNFLASMERFNTALAKSESRVQRFSERARRTATALAAVSGAVTGLGLVSLRAFGNFEQSMARVRAITSATDTEFAALTETARRLGAETQFSAGQAADALASLALSGLSVEEQISALPQVLNLAAAAQLGMADSARILVNVMRGFGLQTADLIRVNDVLVTAFTSSNQNLQELGEALRFAGPVAAAAGLTFEETAATLAVMADAGFQASLGGTALRGAITRLLNPTAEAQRIIQRLGIQITDSGGQLLPFARIVEQLEASGISAGDAMEVFGQRAGPALLALIEQGSGAIRGLEKALLEAGGTAERVREVQMDTFLGSMERLRSAADELFISIGGALSPSIRQFAENIAPVLAGLGRWIEAHPRLTTAVFATAAVLALFSTTLFAIGVLVPGFVAGFGLMTGAVAFLTGGFLALNLAMSPITLIILGITAAIVAAVLIWQNWAAIINFVSGLINDVIDGLNMLIGLLNQANPLRLFSENLAIPDIPNFQEGGVQARSGLAMVGERGPELVHLPAGAVVSPISRNLTFNVNATYTSPRNPSSIRSDLEAIAMFAAR